MVLPPATPFSKKVTIACAGTLPVTAPPLTVTLRLPKSVPCCDTTAVALFTVNPAAAATVTFVADVPVLIACTETVPSGFLNAENFMLPLVAMDVPTRTAPGRTKRDHCAKAQRRLDACGVVPDTSTSALLVVPISPPEKCIPPR